VVLETRSCRVERRLDDEVDLIEMPLPAVLAVTADAALPRVPGMREILAAGKKPTTVWSLDELGASAVLDRSSRVLSTAAPPGTPRRGVIFGGPTSDAARELVGALRRDGVVR
jgi:electron transfer flavoprotein beta subunit